MQSKSFYTHHSAWGSYSSFIIGLTGSGGGFTLSDVKPPNNNIYIGYFRKGEKLNLFPYFTDYCRRLDELSSENHESIEHNRKNDNVELINESIFKRKLNWCTESWENEFINFKLITPFTRIPDPKNIEPEMAMFYFAPVIFAELTFNNSSSKKHMEGLFALRGIRRVLSDSTNGLLLGGANGVSYGFAVKPDETVSELLSRDIVKAVNNQDLKIRRLGTEGGLKFNIKPGEKRRYYLVLGTYQGGYITSYIKTQFYYSYFFSNLEDVLSYGIDNLSLYLKEAHKKDKELESMRFNENKKYLISLATRSYVANTELLVNKKAELVFIVNEGEYQMMNTLDLTVDQVYWEMWFTPWTVKNELDFFIKNYSYYDKVKDVSGKIADGGISFCHDLGVANMFSPKTCSSYELEGLNGCFSYMTHEELLNWLITAAIYIFLKSDIEWAELKNDVFKQILDSIIKRDGNDDGIMDRDSIRCESGSEITTYDCLDESLGQARNSLYLAVKTWAGYVCLENIFNLLDIVDLKELSFNKAVLCAETIISNFKKDEQYIPAVFGNGNSSRIIPAIEGLIYPWIINDKDAVSPDGRFKELFKCLKAHFTGVLKPGFCIDEKSGGWKLSSTSSNTWLSKIFLNQFIAENILKAENHGWDKWDSIHSSWLANECKLWAATDQVRSDTGKDLGSRLYPRLVTSFLWMNKWS